jgi:hypothetical protein
MDESMFDAMARGWGRPSRRRVLEGAAVALLAGFAPLGQIVATAKSGTVDATACARNGKPCRRAAQCCSGVCHQRKCRSAPHQGTCTARQDSCAEGAPELCNQQSGSMCACFVTTAGASFCGGSGACGACTSDGQCGQRLGVAGAACVRATGGLCCTLTGVATACVPPCPAS